MSFSESDFSSTEELDNIQVGDATVDVVGIVSRVSDNFDCKTAINKYVKVVVSNNNERQIQVTAWNNLTSLLEDIKEIDTHRRGSARNRIRDLPRMRRRTASLSRALHIQTRPDDFARISFGRVVHRCAQMCYIYNSVQSRTRRNFYYHYYYCRSLECKGRARSSANFAILLSSYLYPGTGTPSSG
uniref:Replication protein A OB domain-containing protein n=1 Tax=Trichogramma kaykai TaxID=54128 RepID=A0ABD2X3F6_9HYME